MFLCQFMELEIMINKFYSKKFSSYKVKILEYNFYDWESSLVVKAVALHSQAFKFEPSPGPKFYCIFSLVGGPNLTPTGTPRGYICHI